MIFLIVGVYKIIDGCERSLLVKSSIRYMRFGIFVGSEDRRDIIFE